MTMIGAKNLAAVARKWRRLARRKRITLPPRGWHSENHSQESAMSSTSTNSKAEKGHFVVYAADSRRFVLPLAYLDNGVFRELLKLAEEEFGWPRNGPLTVPFDSVFMDYLIWLIRRNVGSDVLEKALVSFMPTSRCLSSHFSFNIIEQENPNLVIQGF